MYGDKGIAVIHQGRKSLFERGKKRCSWGSSLMQEQPSRIPFRLCVANHTSSGVAPPTRPLSGTRVSSTSSKVPTYAGMYGVLYLVLPAVCCPLGRASVQAYKPDQPPQRKWGHHTLGGRQHPGVPLNFSSLFLSFPCLFVVLGPRHKKPCREVEKRLSWGFSFLSFFFLVLIRPKTG